MTEESQIAAPAASVSASTPRQQAVAPAWHTIVFIVVLLGMALYQYRSSATVRIAQEPSLVPTYLLTMAYEFVLLGYVYFFGLRLRKVTIKEVISGRWDRWSQFWMDVGIAFLFWIIVDIAIALISLSLGFSGLKAAESLIPRTVAQMIIWVALSCCAGFCEEIVFRGYLQKQFHAWTGNAIAGVGLQALVFGAAHLYQGQKAVIVLAVYGAFLGGLAAIRKSLRPGIMEHAGQDTVSGILGHFVKNLPQFQHLQTLRF